MPHPPTSAAHLLRRFRRNRRGSAAVEFAMIAPIFIGLLFAIIEVAMVFFASQVLETVTQDSARLILTGQAQNAALTQAQFKDNVCSRIVALFDCANGIYIDVQSFPDFSTINIPDPIATDPSDGSKYFASPNNYNIGGPNNIVVVRVFYQWPILVTRFGLDLTNLRGGKRLLTATAAFQNEPF